MQIRNAILSLLAGVVVFGIGTVVVTEALDPYVWPSLLVGIPIGAVLGLSVVFVTYVSIGYWQERGETGVVSTRTRRRLWATLAAVLAGVVVGGVAVALLATQAVGVVTVLFAGSTFGTVAAALAAALVWNLGREESRDEVETGE